MSFKKFLHDILNWFSHFFENLEKEEKVVIKVAHDVTNKIKELKDFDDAHPEAADIITHLIPGDADDKLKERLRVELPKIIVRMRLIDSSNIPADVNEIIAAGLKFIHSLPDGIDKSAILDNLPKFIIDATSDKKFDWNDLVLIPNLFYRHPQPVS